MSSPLTSFDMIPVIADLKEQVADKDKEIAMLRVRALADQLTIEELREQLQS